METVSRTFLDEWKPPISKKNDQKREKQTLKHFEQIQKISTTITFLLTGLFAISGSSGKASGGIFGGF